LLASFIFLCFAGWMHAADAPAPDVIVMQKMIVEATELDPHPSLFGMHNVWLYVAVPDYEILSRCDAEQTDAVARHIAKSLRGNRQLIPERYLVPLTVPMSFIMFDHEPTRAMEALIPSSDEWESGGSANFGSYFSGGLHRLVGGAVTGDSDTQCVVQNRGGKRWLWAGGSMSTGPIPRGTFFELSRCAPSLPLWYLYGLEGPCGIERGMPGVWAAAMWISQDETSAVLAAARKAHALPALPPIAELFLHDGPTEKNSSEVSPSPAWMAEAALFLRWGFIGEPGEANSHRRAFDMFVDRSRVERVDETMFRECFGFGYAEMQTELSRYLIGATKVPIPAESYAHAADRPEVREYADSEGPPPGLSRYATPSEIARLLGNWERMEGDELKASNPALSHVFLEQAGKTLHKSYAIGERDPRLLAVLGLYDYDVGDLAEAHSILSAATEAGVARPAAYIYLARLEFNEAEAHPAAAGGMFGAQQAAAVLKPLFAARKQGRLDAAGYILIAEAWTRCAAKPLPANLAVLNEGTLLYPFDAALCFSAAKAYAKWDYATDAKALLDRGLSVVNAVEGKELRDLRTSLDTAAAAKDRTKPHP
jgi:hypothetical protein